MNNDNSEKLVAAEGLVGRISNRKGSNCKNLLKCASINRSSNKSKQLV